MALGETARLIASLELDARKFQKSLKAADASLSKTEGRAYHAGQQIGTGIKNGLKVAAAGVGFIAANVALGVDSLIELEKQQAQTNAVIKSTGGIAKVSAADVGRLADKYESLNAIVGDEVIRSGENMLLTFTNIRKKAFEPALAAVLDMNTALGKGPEGLTRTALQVGKALNDPTKGITALRKAGVTFSDAQVKRIKQLQKEGKLYEAQKIILKELNKEFGGSFLAQGNTTAGKVAKFTDAIDDLQRALAEALLPAIGDIADALSELLRDPATQSGIRDLGKDIAGIFSKGNIKAAAKIIGDVIAAIRDAAPTIKSGLGAAADLIGKVVDAFQKLPPDVQKLAIGALAVNKLTGGLITNLAGALLGGALKTITAGNVTVIGASVTGGGAPGGATPVAGGVGKGGGLASTLVKAVSVLFVAELAAEFSPEINGLGADLGKAWREEVRKRTGVAIPTIDLNDLSWPFGPKNTPTILPDLGGNGLLGGLPSGAPKPGTPTARADDRGASEKTALAQYQATQRIEAADRRRAAEEHGRGERLIQTGAQTKAAIDASKARLAAAAAETARETTRGAAATAAAARAGGERAAQAIRDKKLATTVAVTVQNTTNISTRDVAKKLSFSQNMRIYG